MSESLKTALEELAALQSDLPKFEALLAENQQAAETLRRERADLSKQAEQKARVTASRELLEQHLADIKSARAEVSRLETEASRQSTLDVMLGHAKTAQKLRARYDRELQAAVTQLEQSITTLQTIKAGLAEARNGFFDAGRTLLPDAFGVQVFTQNLSREEMARHQNMTAPIFDTLAAKGADLSYILTTYNPNRQFKLDNPRSPHNYRHEGPLAVFLSDQSGL